MRGSGDGCVGRSRLADWRSVAVRGLYSGQMAGGWRLGDVASSIRLARGYGCGLGPAVSVLSVSPSPLGGYPAAAVSRGAVMSSLMAAPCDCFSGVPMVWAPPVSGDNRSGFRYRSVCAPFAMAGDRFAWVMLGRLGAFESRQGFMLTAPVPGGCPDWLLSLAGSPVGSRRIGLLEGRRHGGSGNRVWR